MNELIALSCVGLIVLLILTREYIFYRIKKDQDQEIDRLCKLHNIYVKLYLEEKKSVENLSNELISKVLENIDLKKDVKKLEKMTDEQAVEIENLKHTVEVLEDNLTVSHILGRDGKSCRDAKSCVCTTDRFAEILASASAGVRV